MDSRGLANAGTRRRLETLEMENRPMRRMVVVAGALLLGAGAVMAQQDIAVQQDNLMRAQGKSMYVVIGKMVKGEIPYDQTAVDAAIADLEASVPKIATTFADKSQGRCGERDLRRVAENLAEQGRFRLQDAPRQSRRSPTSRARSRISPA